MSGLGGTVKLTGESEYKKALNDIKTNLKVLSSEMKVVTSQYDENDSSAEKLSAQNEVLNKTLEEQKKKVSLLEEAIEKSRTEKGEDTKQIKEWQIDLNKATADINDMNRQLENNKKAIEEAEESTEDEAETVKDYEKALSEITSDLKLLDKEMQLVTSQYDKNDTSVEKLSAQNEILNSTIAEQERKVRLLKEALEDSVVETGGNSEATKKWRAELYDAEIELNKLNKDLTTNEQVMKQEEEAIKKGYKSFDEMAEAEKKAQKETLSLGDIIKANLISDAIIGGLHALGEGIVSVGKAMFDFGADVVDSYGELEQNLGGSEAVFGEYASNIQKAGEDAYKNLGVSQSDYLATANKMGALFQGSGVEQQKSLELTTQAMQRAADMASVMGIDMQTALDSVAGAAKGNFTMMDNLGVSMNATSIEAYAASKGLDFVWASASQAEKTEMAMQMFFENTSQYAGNFAKESTETISGSFGLVESSWQSLIAGIGNENADLVNLAQNVVGAVLSVVDNVSPIINNIIAALPTVLNTLVGAINAKLPDLLALGEELLQALLGGMSTNLSLILPTVLSVIKTLLNTVLDNLPMILEMGIEMLVALVRGISESLPELIPAVVEAIVLVTKVLLDNLDLIIDTGIELIFALVDGLLNATPDLLAELPVLVDKLCSALEENLPKLVEAGIELTLKLAAGILEATPQLLKMLPQLVSSIVRALNNTLGSLKSVGKNLVEGIWNGIKDATSWILDKIKGFGSSVLNGIKEFFGIHSPSTVMEDEVGANLAYGVGGGFAKTMEEVSRDMQNAIPTEFDSEINTHFTSVSDHSQLSMFDTMLLAFKQALSEVKVMLDDREMGTFVTDTVEKEVFA